jgi:predicted transcriptional regulator
MMQLTKAEEQIMQQLWTLGTASVQDIRERFDDAKPARTTVATILNILENKQFVTHSADRRSHIYAPLVSKEDYSKTQLFGFLKDYFNGSFSSMASFFAKEANLSLEEMDALLEDVRRELETEQLK